jgi:hypothetical protein
LPQINKALRKELFLLFALLIPTISFAQPYSINWYPVAGGGVSTGGAYQVSGTIGPHDAVKFKGPLIEGLRVLDLVRWRDCLPSDVI